MITTAAEFHRARRLALGGTFLVAVSLAVQMSQHGALADDNLMITAPVIGLGGFLVGRVLRLSAAIAIACALIAGLSTLAVSQTGTAYTDELLLLAIPFSGAAAIVTGHIRGWAGKTAIWVSVVCIALAIGIGMTEFPIPYAIAHAAVLISLPNLPVR